MLKEEIVEKISKYFKLTTFEAEKIYDDIFSIIISGVKQDNIVDVANFGEFIIKFNKGNGDSADTNGYKKTVEFLATSKLEDEVNQGSGETVYITPSISETAPVFKTTEEPVTKTPEIPVLSNREEPPQTTVNPVTVNPETVNPVEEELKKKREEILDKITKPVEEIPKAYQQSGMTKPLWKIPVAEKDKLPVENIKEEKTEKPPEVIPEPLKETEKVETVQETIVNAPAEEKKAQEIEDLSQKTFSDFFTELKEENKRTSAKIEETTEQPLVQNVIPPSVVELHNEITNPPVRENMTFPTVETPKPPVATNGNGSANGTGEYMASDNSYYIWYKDVEANATDTQNLSFEYELLYQATKEAEYKSKLKIYVTTFIIFFSIVLVLLIFSPVIYKIFFKPVETPNTEQVNEEKPVTEQTAPNNKAEQNVLKDANTNPQNNNVTPPVTSSDQQQQPNTTQNTTQQSTTQPNTEQPKTETKTQQPVQQQQQTSKPPEKQQQPQQETKLDGVTQNSMGWMDDKFKVIYVKLDNGKYTIQESAWDSDAKANKRIGIVQSLKIDGLAGTMMKADLGAKGTWYRVRFGEFSSLDQARKKAEELRKKEGLKLQASLLLFLLTA